jgi:NADH-quinone oxidoreductase subunit E
MVAFSLSADKEKVVDELIARYPTKMAACIPVLHLCQEERGWVSPDVIEFVAQRLDMSTSQVKGVVTFYTMYHQEEVAPNVIWVCRTLSCDLRGGKAIQEHLEKRLGCGVGETSRDGKVTLQKAECLAACGNAPMIQLNDEYHEHLTVEKLDRILDDLGVAPLTGELRTAPAPVREAPAAPEAPTPEAAALEEGEAGDGDEEASAEGEEE